MHVLDICAQNVTHLLPTAVAGYDYVAVANEPLVFNTGDMRMCHTITIRDDSECEIDPNDEQFFSDLSYVSGSQPISIDPDRATVIINDAVEPECRK